MLGESAVEDPEPDEGGLSGERASLHSCRGRLLAQGGSNTAKCETCVPASRLVFGFAAASSTASATSPLLSASAHVALSAIVAPLAGPVVPFLSFGWRSLHSDWS
jgi:hypothetical protein